MFFIIAPLIKFTGVSPRIMPGLIFSEKNIERQLSSIFNYFPIFFMNYIFQAYQKSDILSEF
jgi:hypothetical protein